MRNYAALALIISAVTMLLLAAVPLVFGEQSDMFTDDTDNYTTTINSYVCSNGNIGQILVQSHNDGYTAFQMMVLDSDHGEIYYLKHLTNVYEEIDALWKISLTLHDILQRC